MKNIKEQELLHTIVTRAWEDKSFKQKLITDPESALEPLMGKTIKLPKGKRIVVQDQTDASVIYINIPAAPNREDMELNEEQLEIIAGGGRPDPILRDPSASLSGLF